MNSSTALYGFLNDTTIHGCSRIVKNSTGRRYLWVLIVTASISIWMTMLIIGINSIYTYQVKTQIKFENKKSIDFPIVTICTACGVNTWNSNISKEILDVFLVNSHWLLLRKNLNTNLTLDRQLFIDSYSSLELTLNDVILQARWNIKELNITSNFHILHLLDNVCFQFNGDQNHKFRSELAGAQTGLEIIADSRQYGCPVDTGGLRVYIHDDEEFSQSSYILLSPGFSANVALSKKLVTYLPRPYKSIGGRYCNDDPTYSRSKCVRQCIDNMIEEKCPCYISVINRGERKDYCNPDSSDSFNCMMTNLKLFYRKAERRQLCSECPDQCVITQFQADISYSMFPSNAVSDRLFQRGYTNNISYARNNMLKFSVYYKNMYIFNVQHEAKHTIESVVGTVGGLIGFYLGASVLSSIEIIEVICYYGWSLVKKLFCSGFESKTKVKPFVP